MRCIRRILGFGAFLAATSAAAGAQATDPPAGFCCRAPTMGTEHLRITSAALHSDFLNAEPPRTAGISVAYGGRRGWVVLPHRAGGLDSGVGSNPSHVGEWAFHSTNTMSRRSGGGGHATVAAGYRVSRLLSLGPELRVDGWSYIADQRVRGSWGVTGGLCVVLHF